MKICTRSTAPLLADAPCACARAWTSLATAVLVFFAAAAQAQTGVELAGRVLDPAGAAIPLATVSARPAPGGEPASTRTDRQGRYILRLPTGSEFVVRVERLGFVTTTFLVETKGAARVERDVRLNPVPVAIAPLVARGTRSTVAPLFARETPGESQSTELASTAERFPFEPGDLAALAALAPGVVAVGDGEDEGVGVSIAGQAPSQNRTVVDGAGFGASSLPREAVARAGAITHLYDVGRGQFTGGLVTATTRSGTSLWGGAVSTSLRPPLLQYGVAPASNVGQRYSSVRVDAGGGGPLLREKLFAFAALQLSRRTADTPFLDAGDAPGLRRIGVAADSVRRFYGILDELGVARSATPASARSDAASALARLDYLLADKHTAVLRLDWRGTSAGGLGSSPLSPAGGYAGRSSSEGGVLAQLSSRFGPISHEVRAYWSAGTRESSAALRLPTAYVQVSSPFTDPGETGIASLGLGGGSLPSTRAERSVLETSDEVVLTTAGGAHRIRAGGGYIAEEATLEGALNPYGTFTFGSLADLEAGRPATYTRTLGNLPREGTARTGTLFVGDTWRPAAGWGVTFGVRVEGSEYGDGGGAPSPLGGMPGRVPSEVRASPRAGFTYDNPARHLTLHGGTGEFRGRLPVDVLAAVAAETGASAVELACVGRAAPIPDWRAYAADPSTIPSSCIGESTLASRFPRTTLVAGGFGAPRVWNSSFGGRWVARGRHFVDFSLAMIRGLNVSYGTDLNLHPDARFGLATEGNRPVFVPADVIDPLSGSTPFAASRIRPELGTVRRVDDGARSRTEQLTLGVSTLTPGTGAVSLSYAFTRARQQGTGLAGLSGGMGSTGGDPARLEWGPGDFDQRHAVQLYYLQRVTRTLGFTALARWGSGFPFTPMVQGDVNGDGAFNDRAFIFAPADPVLGGAMSRLLGEAPSPAAECLRRQMGRVAGRNSCRTPASTTLDLKATLRPRREGSPRRLSFTATAQNVTAGVDFLFHGADGLRGWGQSPSPDATLLRVTGFDPTARAFRYEVNPAFGTLAGTRSQFRTPFTVVLEGRMTLGSDPAFQPLERMVNRLRTSPQTRQEARRSLAEQIPNVPARILTSADSLALALTSSQAEGLRAAADSLHGRIAALADSLAEALLVPAREPRAAVRARTERLRTLTNAARTASGWGVERARAILTPEQWERIPESLRQLPALPFSGPRELRVGEGPPAP